MQTQWGWSSHFILIAVKKISASQGISLSQLILAHQLASILVELVVVFYKLLVGATVRFSNSIATFLLEIFWSFLLLVWRAITLREYYGCLQGDPFHLGRLKISPFNKYVSINTHFFTVGGLNLPRTSQVFNFLRGNYNIYTNAYLKYMMHHLPCWCLKHWGDPLRYPSVLSSESRVSSVIEPLKCRSSYTNLPILDDFLWFVCLKNAL